MIRFFPGWRTSLLFSLACFACVPLAHSVELRRLNAFEPYYGSPALSPVLAIRSDPFGQGHYGASRNGGRRHKGIDVAIPLGEPVVAAKSGRVTIARDSGGYGLLVEIAHPDGLRTRYAHLASLSVSEGDWVNRSQAVGLCGKTGNAREPRMTPHVHFEIRRSGEAADPFAGLLEPSIRTAQTRKEYP